MTMTGIERVGSTADVGVEDIALVGRKAARFATLGRAGFPVPEGGVLATDALAGAGLDDGARRAAIEAMSLPTNLRQALPTAVERLGSGRRAVRTSGVDELHGPDRIGRTW